MTSTEKFIRYLKEYVHRDGVNSLIEWLNTNEFFSQSASTKYHSSYPGGLVDHSVRVFERLLKRLKNEYGDTLEKCPYTRESIVIVSLLHDIGKTNLYKMEQKNVKNEAGVWEQVDVYVSNFDAMVCTTHEEESARLASKFINLTDDEYEAIRYHAGAWASDNDGYNGKTMKVFERNSLAYFLHDADMSATICDEKN